MRKVRFGGPFQWVLSPVAVVISVSLLLLLSGCGVTVNKLSPTVTIAASPTSVSAGGTSTLTVVAANATSVTVTGTDGSSYSMSATGGAQTVTPKATTTYTATASGANGQATATVTVSVAATPPPATTVTISANPTTINAGGTSTLTVAATNATKVTIAGSDGSSYSLAATGGTQSVTPGATTTYTATATGASGTTPVTATATVTVVEPGPPTVTITASPSSVNAGASSTLTVTATGATTVTVSGTDGSTYTLAAAGGTQPVTPKSTTTYQATATGAGGSITAQTTVTVLAGPKPTVSITANPTSIVSGNTSTLTVVATNATTVTITGDDNSSYPLPAAGGTQAVKPTKTTTYTATATGPAGTVTSNPTATVTVTPAGTLNSVDHVIFMLQENHSFDNYFGMLNPYRQANHWNVGDDGKTYDVDGIDDKLGSISNQDDEGDSFSPFKLSTTCIDDLSSAWLESYGDVSRFDFTPTRKILMDGFVHDAEGFANNCAASGTCSGTYTDLKGQRAMGYYDESYLNYYYFMAAQFAVSNRWFSPVSSKSIPNRIATFTGGTTQGLVFDPGADDKLPQLKINTIFNELDQAQVSWKVYYTVTNGGCTAGTACGSGAANLPDTTFSILQDSFKYFYVPMGGTACTGTTQPSSVVGDTSNSFCIDPNHVAPLSTYFTDLKNGTLPSFAFIESGSGVNDEHPGSGQSVLMGQAQVANIINSLMSSTSWQDSVFFFAYDEGGGPYDHVPPVPGHTNDFTTDPTLKTAPDIASIAVNPESNPSYFPCVPTQTPGAPTVPATTHCDLRPGNPGVSPGDAPAQQGFAAQLGFRVPNMIISPFVRKHYVGNNPMDHTAILKFVENRFIGSSAHLTARDAAQPDLTDFFDFTNVPWATPPTGIPTPTPVGSSCHADTMQ